MILIIDKPPGMWKNVRNIVHVLIPESIKLVDFLNKYIVRTHWRGIVIIQETNKNRL